MRILIGGAGAIGGYFGGRLLQAGRDVIFLVRPRRAAQLAKTGLAIRSPRGDADLGAPTITAEQLRSPYDLVLLSCKAYDLVGAMDSFAPAVGPETAILPLLNGIGHLEALAARFGKGAALGGQVESILQDMWEKWTFIATAAGITCLMRASVGDIVAAGGAPIAEALLDEISAIA